MRYFFKLLLTLSFSVQALCLNAKTDSLKNELLRVKDDTLRIAILSDLSFEYANRAPDSALLYQQMQQAIADRINIPKYTANALNDLAVIQYYKSDYTNALINNKKALEIRQRIGDKSLIVSSLNKIAVIYQEQGDYEQGATYQLQVLKLAEDLKNDQFILITLNNISTLYQKVKKFDEALRYSRQALSLAKANNDTFEIAITYAVMQSGYAGKNMMDSAIVYQLRAIDLFKQTNSLSQLAAAYNDLAYLYRSIGQHQLGIYYYKLAFNASIKMESGNDEAFYAANIGSAYIDQRQADSADFYLKTANSIRTADLKQTVLRTLYHGLAGYYILKKRPDSAMHYYDMYCAITDTIYSAALAGQYSDLLFKYESEKKQQQIELLNKQNTIKQLSIEYRNVIIAGIIAFFILAVILAVLFYNRYRLKQTAILHEEILKQQQMASKAVIAAEEMERQRIARDLHDGIGQLFSTVKMNLSGIADRINITEEAERVLMAKTLSLVDESCREVRAISHQMMPNVLLKLGLHMAVKDFIDKIDAASLKVTLETFGLNESIDPNVEIVLYRVIQESVNNVIRHARASTLYIQLDKDAESITVTIEDNGTGFDTTKSRDGIGLKSIKARVAFLNGKVDYDSAPGKGTLVAVYIPYKADESKGKN